MCCFSKSVDVVADTNIFARASKDGRQFLVYSMQFAADQDLAMILPIPTPKGSADDAVKFISLKKYEAFFDDLRKGFPIQKGRGPKKEPMLGGLGAALPVVEVGDFIASFVPAVKDFARLDEKFRLPEGVWAKLPQYKEFGFAVFKLKKPEKDLSKVHPMAFEFPRADKRVLFFPTVHIHDGTVGEKADFDHSLFCQVEGNGLMSWDESAQLAESFVKVKEAHGIVDGNAHVYRKVMKGEFENKDILV
ncbi:hypothetical protein R5W23_002311 [Gemmata sp. JC673]|uniref:Uncharacterized protein n=1 Tax=Gemmata algarum TaxID=2975278 RepID=A0ABU5F0F8_9BACT|nr:hypothetical protein [Gemmata algarum]MDY3561052.1 hypothetical protein [Gemmata algarum]